MEAGIKTTQGDRSAAEERVAALERDNASLTGRLEDADDQRKGAPFILLAVQLNAILREVHARVL